MMQGLSMWIAYSNSYSYMIEEIIPGYDSAHDDFKVSLFTVGESLKRKLNTEPYMVTWIACRLTVTSLVDKTTILNKHTNISIYNMAELLY